MHRTARTAYRFLAAVAQLALFVVLVVSGGAALAVKGGDLKGAPTFTAGAVLGAFFWQDDAGLHARFSTDGKAERAFAGKLCSKGITRLDAVDLEETDKLEVGGAGKCVNFEFVLEAGVDGYDFAVEGPLLRFEVTLDGKPINLKLVALGKDGKHPKQKRFVVELTK
jgi:hypothetical protein